ncbi:hypothetical protein [Bacillus cereus]
MKVAILDGKFYLCVYEGAFGWYGYQITHEAYDALRDCELDDDSEMNLNKYEKELS